MSFAIPWSIWKKRRICISFNSLFVGMSFAIPLWRENLARAAKSFNSLFVGMSFAIWILGPCVSSVGSLFQFPFRRDELCNSRHGRRRRVGGCMFQFPFRRDELCNALRTTKDKDSAIIGFNSLFVGMSFAIPTS